MIPVEFPTSDVTPPLIPSSRFVAEEQSLGGQPSAPSVRRSPSAPWPTSFG
jgi:hypothetical protein